MIGRLLFWLATATYLTLYFHKKSGHYIPWISDYMADLLCMPIVFAFCLAVLKFWRVVSKDFELSASMIIVAVIYFSLVFEWILPSLSEKHHADTLDIVAYSLGALAYYYLRKILSTKQYDLFTIH